MMRTHAGGLRAVGSDPGVLRDVLEGLIEQYPGLKAQFFSEDGSLHQFVNVYVNDEDVRYLENLDTKVSDGDVVSVLPAIAGGARRYPALS